MSKDVKSDTPKPVAVTEDGTDTTVRVGDDATKSVRVKIVGGSLAASTTAKATAAPPTYVEGVDSPISQDLSGNLRTLASVSATTTAKATAADPSYSEGVDSPISQDRTGHLRTTGLTDTQLRATAVPVSASSLPLPANAAIETGGHLASLDGKDFATQATLALIKAKTDNLDAALSTLATQATLAQIKTDVDKIPASPSQEHVTAGSPHSVELSDGAAFYTAAKTGQLPTALDGSGFLKTHEQGIADVTPAKATAAAPTYVEASKNPLSVDLSGNLRVVSVGGTTYFPLTESSTYDGVSATLTLGHTPTDEPRVFIGGLRWYLGVNYSRVGAVITWISIPISGETIQIDYTWSMASSTLNSTLVVDVSGNVQPTGDTSARPIHVVADNLEIGQGSAIAGIKGPLMQGVTSDTVAQFYNDVIQPLQLTSDGRLRVQTASESNNFTPWGDPFAMGDGASMGGLLSWG